MENNTYKLNRNRRKQPQKGRYRRW